MSETLGTSRDYEVAWEIARVTNDAYDRKEELESDASAIERIHDLRGISIEGDVESDILDQADREQDVIDELNEIAEVALPDQEGYDGTTDIHL